MDTQTGGVKDKFLAAGTVTVLLACYMALKLLGADTTFIEGAFLMGLGAFIGLLKQSASPQTNVRSEGETNILQQPKEGA